MDEEVEVIEPQYNWEKELPVQAEIVTTQVPVQRIIINGEEQTMMGEANVLICPKCRTIIQQFQPGVSTLDICLSLDTQDQALLKQEMHCPKCGQVLKLFRPLPIDCPFEDIGNNL